MRNRFVVLLLSVGLLGGCAQNRVKETPKPSMGLDRLVAYDFVNVLAQIDGFHPNDAKLQMTAPRHSFGAELKQVFLEANYDVQMVETESGDQFVEYSRVNGDDQSKTYSLSVGHVSMERDYITKGNGDVLPSSDLLVEGVDAALITLYDGQPFSIQIPAITEDPPATQADNSEIPVVVEPVPLASDLEKLENTYAQNSVKKSNSVSEDVTPNNSSFTVLVNGDESPRGYSEGESLVFTLQAQSDMRVSCYFQDPDANVMRMYPNSFATNATVLAGETVHIPATDQWSIQASRAGYKDEVLCVSVAPSHMPAMEEFDASPDFELLAFKSLDELLINLSAAIGVNPESKRVSINVY